MFSYRGGVENRKWLSSRLIRQLERALNKPICHPKVNSINFRYNNMVSTLIYSEISLSTIFQRHRVLVRSSVGSDRAAKRGQHMSDGDAIGLTTTYGGVDHQPSATGNYFIVQTTQFQVRHADQEWQREQRDGRKNTRTSRTEKKRPSAPLTKLKCPMTR